MLVPYEGARNEGNVSIKTLFLALWLVRQMCTNAHDCSQHLNHEQHKEPDHIKALIGTEPFRGEEALLENTKILF